MDNVILTQINGLTSKYEKELVNFINTDNEFLVFNFDYQNYYKPFIKYILPEIDKHLKSNKNETFDTYKTLINHKYYNALLEDLNQIKPLNSDFLKKLSDDITNDFNKLWVAYRKMSDSLKNKFISQFINNRKKALIIIAENHPELAIKTISKLRCPKLQFYLINKLNPILTKHITNFLENHCWERKMKILKEYFYYPQDIAPKIYFEKWEGEPFLHIKFCKIIMGQQYENSKKFLKLKDNYEKI